MATRSRDTTPLGKEMRGKSPSSPLHPMRSPNSPRTSGPVRKQADNSTTSNKTVPNYLKPTMSSSSDPNIHTKPTLTRMRSFDKPPVAALQKTAVPKERVLRTSSSFSAKTSTSHKPLSDRLSRASIMTKDATGKQRGTSLNSRQISKKTRTNKKLDGSTRQDDTHKSRNHQGGTAKASIVTDAPHAPEDVIPPAETGQDDMHKSKNEQDDPNDSTTKALIITNSPDAAEDVIPPAETEQDDMDELRADQDGLNGLTPKASTITSYPHAVEDAIPQDELSEQENQELPVIESERDVIINSETAAIEDQEELHANVTNAEIEDLKAAESSSIVVETKESINIEEPEEKLLVEETSTINHKEQEETTSELLNEPHLEENTTKVADENQQEKEEVEGRNNGKEAAREEGGAVQETNTTVASSKPQRQVMHGKKESVVSNDVIEETASKLREQRKNRVKALAGAFETVISLQ